MFVFISKVFKKYMKPKEKRKLKKNPKKLVKYKTK